MYRGTIDLTTGSLRAGRAYLAATRFGADLPQGEYVFLTVADTGSGMDAATLDKIFDPFFTSKVSERGLGLAVTIPRVASTRRMCRLTTSHSSKNAALLCATA